MPVTGRKPKPETMRRHRNKPTFEWVEVADVPYTGKAPAADRAWPAATKRWWRAVCRMPHCVLWTEVDWEFALGTAGMMARFHEGDMRVATELRNREKVMGTTLDFRRDLRIRYVSEGPAEEASVTKMSDYRAMLGSEV